MDFNTKLFNFQQWNGLLSRSSEEMEERRMQSAQEKGKNGEKKSEVKLEFHCDLTINDFPEWMCICDLTFFSFQSIFEIYTSCHGCIIISFNPDKWWSVYSTYFQRWETRPGKIQVWIFFYWSKIQNTSLYIPLFSHTTFQVLLMMQFMNFEKKSVQKKKKILDCGCSTTD